jgi:hypothetical protein
MESPLTQVLPDLQIFRDAKSLYYHCSLQNNLLTQPHSKYIFAK